MRVLVLLLSLLSYGSVALGQQFVGTQGVVMPPNNPNYNMGVASLWGGGASLNSSNIGWGGYPSGFGSYCSIPGFVDPNCFGWPSRTQTPAPIPFNAHSGYGYPL